MAFELALDTKNLINDSIEADQGAAYRQALGRVIPHIGDAYRGADEGFRSHLGASQIGRTCAREIWYGFRWAMKSHFDGRMLRLFNRGHLEEARFIAMFLSVGIKVWQQDENGNQFRISELGGHFGGSGDGIGVGFPDLPPGAPAVLEFKTHNNKSFEKLAKEGVQIVKPEHYAQMQTYMRKMNLMYSIYGASNKDNDDIHLEVVRLNPIVADQYIDRGRQIVLHRTPPDKINNSPSWYECKWCDKRDICHYDVAPEVNCRTCHWSYPAEDGTWRCLEPNIKIANKGDELTLSKELQLVGCGNYVRGF